MIWIYLKEDDSLVAWHDYEVPLEAYEPNGATQVFKVEQSAIQYRFSDGMMTAVLALDWKDKVIKDA